MQQCVVVGLADPVDEQIGIETWNADHRQHFAIARIDGDRPHRSPCERVHTRLLDTGIDGQVDVLPWGRRDPFQHAQGSTIRIDFDQFIAGLAVQQVLIGALDPCLAACVVPA